MVTKNIVYCSGQRPKSRTTLKPEIHTPAPSSRRLVIAETIEVHGEHLVFLRSDDLAALFILEMVELV
jgi:hypothetical protein